MKIRNARNCELEERIERHFMYCREVVAERLKTRHLPRIEEIIDYYFKYVVVLFVSIVFASIVVMLFVEMISG